jgi:queuosine precursor transporter
LERLVSDKKTYLFFILSSIFLTNAVLAEMIGVKLFSAENLLGLPSAQLQFLADTRLDFNLTAGVIIWPVVFVTTDIINEYYGPRGVKRISYLTVGLILYAFLVIGLVTMLPPAQVWLDLNSTDGTGKPFNIDYAFNAVFRQSLGIIIGSVVAFLVAQLLDAYVFQYLRRFTGSRKIWLRATGSTLVSQLIDSFVVLYIAFFVFGNWDMRLVLSVALLNYTYKFFMAIALTPVLYASHYLIGQYLGPEVARQMADSAGQKQAPPPVAVAN